MSLNPPQQLAVNTLAGPLLVLAGAGSGKTRVVTYRIANLIKHGIAPSRILAVTFTNKAAREMQARAALLLGKRAEQKPEISTFHSLCVRVLRRQIQQLGYPPQFAIYDRGDQESTVRSALREIKVPNESLRPGDALNIISRWKSNGIRPDAAAAHAHSDKEHLAAMVYRRYQKAVKAAGAVDFDDLLLLTEEIFQRFPPVRQAESQRLDHLLIDEYQDTNGSQYRIVKALASGHRNLCVVGDDDQSIYGWRGAEVEHILRFQHDWPDAKVVRLEDNYRSTEAILELANRVIAYNQKRHDKILRAARKGGERPRIEQYPDEALEAERVVADIAARLRVPGTEPRDFAILFRTNEQPRPFEMELRKAKLPYILVGGMSFYDRKEVRDILAYCKTLVNPRDEVALLRIINNPPRGIARSVVQKLLDAAVAQGQPIWELLSKASDVAGLSTAAVAALESFQRLIQGFADRLAAESSLAVVSDLIRKIHYQDELAKLYPDPNELQSRWGAVEEVVNALAAFEKKTKQPTLAAFLESVALDGREDSDDKESQLARNAIALMTLHSAKGLEFPQVYLVGMEEGLLPHHRSVAVELTQPSAIDEERRLCYVGITRAQDRLTMTLALSRMKWGKSRDTIPSRFLFEITGEAEKGAPPPRPRSAPSGGARPGAKPAAPTTSRPRSQRADRQPPRP
ncbi:MAG TPA: UvrD-helicase domain-containing protein [Pirellulales bacterium]|nr:UvrD-helicase domain-containing protein [Pirellulales bacterium]